MQKYSVVKENQTLVRDENNQAILNTDNAGLVAYKKRKQHAKTVESSLQDINNMKQDINDLKTLMQRILDKIG